MTGFIQTPQTVPVRCAGMFDQDAPAHIDQWLDGVPGTQSTMVIRQPIRKYDERS
jgi:hypothetical protein